MIKAAREAVNIN